MGKPKHRDEGWARYPRSNTTLDAETEKEMEKVIRAYHEDLQEFEPETIEPAVEGARQLVYINAYERSRKAREACKEHHGSACAVCAWDFRKVYGPALQGYIHIHHLKPLSEIGEAYILDPIHDLVPVCPNCHAVMHSQLPPLTVQQVKEMMSA